MTATTSKRKIKKSEICARCNDLWENHTCYWSPCPGCPNGHASMHKTLTESKEWREWVKENSRRFHLKPIGNCFDIDECHELGIMSKEHWEEFIKFTKGSIPHRGKIK
jgi:hypothetical protein